MILRSAFALLTRPGKAVDGILRNLPRWKELLIFLGLIGCLRGFLEIFWLYGMAYRPGLWELLWQERLRHGLEAALFLAANSMTAYLRWAMYGFLFLAVARWFGRRVAFRDGMTLAGLLLALYLVPVLVNALYLLFPLPIIRFDVAQAYRPVIGLGQVVTAVWFIWVAQAIFRRAGGLTRGEALSGGIFIALLDRALFVGAAWAVFRWDWLSHLPVATRMLWVSVGFLAVAVAAVPLLLRFGRRVAAGGEEAAA